MQTRPHLIFYRCPRASELAGKIESNWTWEEAENLRDVGKNDDGETDIVILTSFGDSVYWEFWIESHPAIPVFQVLSSNTEVMMHQFTDWLDAEVRGDELSLRIYYGLVRFKELRRLKDSAKKASRTQKIQLNMNDRLLNVSMELKKAKEKIEELSMTDSLTQLKNRRFFDFQLSRDLLQSSRYKTPLSLYIMDIDNFKGINDRFGHQVGDEILVRFGDLVGQSLRDSDWAARYGGEEFVVILPMTANDGALISAERMRALVEKELATIDDETHTISIGVATFEGNKTMVDLIKCADDALYKAKRTGKNKVVNFDNQSKECREYPS
jgi:diguanylate cyclase (GGDEF)-like protein